MKKIFLALLMCSATALTAQNKHTLPPLPYAENALEPVMSKETVQFHHGKHVQAYVDNLNRLIPGTEWADATLEQIIRTSEGTIFDNGAQIWNHTLFFETLAPESEAKHLPEGALAQAIDAQFGSFDEFKRRFSEEATGLFGSGWVWLAVGSQGDLHIFPISNAGNPLQDGFKPILGLDVWEHSYYIDYRNARKAYVENIWRIIDWSKVEKRFEE